MDALLIVDFQNDFTPGGALPVERGDEIAGPINALAQRFELVIATRDWHPPDHGSFAGVEVDPERWEGIDPPGIWPEHCVQGTPGAELHPSLDRSHVDGLATDYCVKNTVLDAEQLGFSVTVVEDAVRGIEVQPGDIEAAKVAMRGVGAGFISSHELLAQRAATA